MTPSKDDQLVGFFCGDEGCWYLHLIGLSGDKDAEYIVKREINDFGCDHNHAVIRTTWNQLMNRRFSDKTIITRFTIEREIINWIKEFKASVQLVEVNAHYVCEHTMDEILEGINF